MSSFITAMSPHLKFLLLHPLYQSIPTGKNKAQPPMCKISHIHCFKAKY